ncbi:MAG: aspartate-semialdehyde dehydrogenase, partial [Bdellovibrionales bacterium RIFOXYB2_FULL_36_6]
MSKIGIVGIRGMVGGTLIERMIKEKDFEESHQYSFFSSSAKNQPGPKINHKQYTFLDAYDLDLMHEMNIILTTQGSDYTKDVYASLRKKGWTGYWIDAASYLRMEKDVIIGLDPINDHVIKEGLARGIKTFVGGNCTVSLLLMGIGNLIKNDWIEWISTMTYQAISGAGAKQIGDLLKQVRAFDIDEQKHPLKLEKEFRQLIKQKTFPLGEIGHPLAFNLLPWIDAKMEDGRTKEEWKGQVELNKIMGLKKILPVDGICVRVPTFRSHAQAVTIKLKKNITIKTIEKEIAGSNSWVKLIPNDVEESKRYLTPLAVSGTLDIAVGRIKQMSMGKDYI